MVDSIKIKNIYYMLSYAYHRLNETGFNDLASEDFKNIHDLLAAILVKGVTNQVKRGLHKNYIMRNDALKNLKGKIDFTCSLKQQTFMRRQMVCQYDEFSEDILLNQILKFTMMTLLRYGDVKIENKKALRKLLIFFSQVNELEANNINWSLVSYHRNNATYKTLINICWFVIKGLLLTTDSGNIRLASFLDDQRMYQLFERFVLNYYRKEHPEYKPSAAYIDWDTDDDKQYLPIMKTDITLTCGERVLIIDTKYYGHTMQVNDLYDSKSIISDNLYQIYSYVKNRDKLSSGNVSGLLLYAKTTEEITPDNDFLLGGNMIGVKTLNLGTEWTEIKKQLDAVSQYLQ